ncbi:hypothetical protein IQ07DRAFT_599308 [Pyrenochaeta sp. DS3sAY3a]|nr:hypothetical protein IQ07DRAFT_599308 [Pyrenochaeta sp. DS3sAY3a]
MGRPFLSSIPHTSRSFHHIRYRVVVLLLVFALFQQQHLFHVHRQSLAAKYSSTDFTSSNQELQARFTRPDDEDSHFQEELLANQESWNLLGAGWEGKVFVYKDSVIKTFTPGRSPFRNCAPSVASEKWPTEIPASLRFGGFWNHLEMNGFGRTRNESATLDGFLAVQTYFKASVVPSQPKEWFLVTPYLDGGNLNKLSRELSTSTSTRNYQELDSRYRPAFNRLLKDMKSLHQAGYCHDDIKPANIFIRDSSHWVLGDLGNLRETSHPYHSSRLWRDNQQLEDCRANDAVRALKSYLQFIQSSASDADEFRIAFFEGAEPISRLFWWTLAGARSMSAAALYERSLIEYPEAARSLDMDLEIPSPDSHRSLIGVFSRRMALKGAVDDALQTRVGEKIARWWAMTWIFGLPVSDVCGV